MSALPGSSSDPLGKRLESWKEIAGHVNRHVTTVRRWEKEESLPVHRHLHSTLGSVYAYARELDAWLRGRQPDVIRFPSAKPSAHADSSGHLPTPPTLTGARPWPGVLLGRDTEMARLRKVWSAASAGQRQIVLITGEAGQGKTRLMLDFARSIAGEATILTGSCEREALLPFAPFVTMLQWVLRTGESETLQRILKKMEGTSELEQLVPEIAKRLPNSPQDLRASPESRRYRMFDAFAQLAVAISQDCPILLLFEDVHWADTGSLLFLRHLIRSTRDAAICIAITYRENDSERSAFSEEILQEFGREPAATRICLGGLPSDNVRQLVELWTTQAVRPALANWIFEQTEGNPLFVTEMLKHFDETGGFARLTSTEAIAETGVPERMRQLIRHRFARLSPASKKVLTVGAVIGREFGLALVETLTERSEDDVLDAIEEAIAAGVVAETPGVPGQFSFAHALIRETLYADTMAARRVRLHHRIGQALERTAQPGALPLGELAYHFNHAADFDPDTAIEYAVRAGDQAHRGLALEDAARYYGMALRACLRLQPGPAVAAKLIELHTLRGRSLFAAGQWAEAKAEFEAALDLTDPSEVLARCELLLRLAEVSFWLMDVPALRRFAGNAEALADQTGRDDLWADARAWMASADVADGDVLGGIDADRQTLARVGGIHSFGLARIPLTLYWAGHTREAAARAEEAVENARGSGDYAFLLYALQHLGLCLSGAGRYDEAIRVFDEACTFGRQCGAFPLLARATSMSVAPLLSLGDFVAAENRALEARELAHRVAFEPPIVSAGIDLLLIHARTDDPGRAESLIAEVDGAVQEATGWHGWKWKMRLSQARAELAFAKGEWMNAIAFAGDVIERARCRNRPKYQALALSVRARARRELGMRDAVQDAKRAVAVARQLSDPVLLVQCLGVLLEQDGTDALCLEHRRAVDFVLQGVTDKALRGSFLARVPVPPGLLVREAAL